jgi:AraC-like DNA-binding protein
VISTNIDDIRKYAKTELLCAFLIHPLGYMKNCYYPADIFCDFHVFSSYFTALILDGEMCYTELGHEKHFCRRGDLLVLPKHCRYSWQTYQPTRAFHCQHSDFAICDYGKLSFLFGINLKHIETVHVGEEYTSEFEAKLKSAQTHMLKELYYSTAVLELFSRATEIFISNVHEGDSDESTVLIRQYVYYIESRLDHEMTIRELANYRNISERSLFLLFKKHMNMSPMEYVSNRKVENAKRLICSSGLSCDELALQLGFSSSNYFIRFFKKHTGTTPMQYRKQKL